MLVANVLAALGGCWWPIDVSPEWMQTLAGLLPTGWVVGGLHELGSFGRPAIEVLPETLSVAAATLLVLVLAARTFRYR